MFTLHPGVRVKAALYDGVVNVMLRPGSGGTDISYDLDSVDIARQRLLMIPGAAAGGTLSGSGGLWLSPGDIAQTGDGVLSATGLTFTSPFAEAPIRLGDGHSKFKLDQGTLTIEEFTTSGRRFDVERRGHSPVRAQRRSERARDPVHSHSRAERRSANAGPARNAAASPSSQPYYLSGTLNAPRIS